MTTMNTVTLETVEQEFSAWRATKKSGEKIPECLWERVKILLKHYKRSQVLNRLGIALQQAREKGIVLNSPSSATTQKNVAPFIEIPLAEVLQQPITPTPVVTLKRGELTLSLKHPTEAQLHLLLNTVVK